MLCDFGKKSKAFKEGQQFMVDGEDYIKHFKDKTCHIANGYVMTGTSPKKGISRIIMGVSDPKVQVDHINHDKFDNRKQNLRVVSPQQNAYNKNVYKNNESGYTGVHLYKPTGKYMAYIKADGKRKHLGYYKPVEEAYTAYVRASKELHGEYAPTRIQEMDVGPLLEPVPKIYKSSKWAIENYRKNQPHKLRNQILRNIKKTGKTPKDSTIEKHTLTAVEIETQLTEYRKINPIEIVRDQEI